MRRPALKIKPRIAKLAAYPAPVGGWVKNTNMAAPDARMPDGTRVNGAFVLENWLPTTTGARMRGGSERYATLGDGTKDVVAAFTYINGNNRRLFATTENALFDITTVLDPELLYLVDDLGNQIVDDLGNALFFESAPATVSALTGGEWSVVQFATSGGTFLRCVNGMDVPLVFDGTSWGTSPAITGPDPATLIFVWAFKNRLFFIQKETLDIWYLAADAIGGAATKFPMGGIFNRGGSLLFGSAWSLDTGSGLNEQCIFCTTEGEVAVFQGSDPSSASTWQKVGVYRIGRPLGSKAFIRAGGDLVIATDIGLVPLTQAVQRDIAALSPSAVSYPIEVAWNDAVSSHSGLSWHCEVWPTKQMVLVAVPFSSGERGSMFAANARTGRWGHYTGWRGTCLVLFGERMFFGSTNGRIVEAEVTGADEGAAYTATCVPLFDPLKAPASLKTGLQARVVLLAPGSVETKLSLQKDFVVSLPSAPDDVSVPGGSLWGSAVWGESKWGASVAKQIVQQWQSVPGQGYALSPALQITSGSTAPPGIELVRADLTYDIGDLGS